MTSSVQTVKAVICFALIGLCGVMLFVPVVETAEEVRAMFVLLTGIAVRDYFGSTQEDKRMAELKESYQPSMPQAFVNGADEE